MRRSSWLVLTFTALACATSRPIEAPPVKAGSWRELRSEHFTLETDQDLPAAQAMLDKLERIRTALITSAWGAAKIEGDHLEVIAFRDGGDLDEFTENPSTRGVTVPGFHAWMVTGELGSMTEPVLTHELTHALSRRLLQRQPPWFAEGIADFLGTLHVNGDVATFGDVNALRYPWLRRLGPMSSARVLGLTRRALWDKDPDEVELFYATSWLLVHYLFNHEPRRFREYQIALARAEDPTTAWARIFPDLGPDKLDQALAAYVEHGSFRVLEVPLPPAAPHPAPERLLSATEIRVLRARLFLAMPGPMKLDERARHVQAELAQRLAQDPTDPAVVDYAGLWMKHDAWAQLVHASVEKHPDDVRAWRALEALLSDAEDATSKAERLRAAQRVAALSPGDAGALNDVAWELTRSGRAAEALPLARQAVQLDPEPSGLDTLAAAEAGAGDCTRALKDQQRALELTPPEQKHRFQSFSTHLQQMQARCGADSR